MMRTSRSPPRNQMRDNRGRNEHVLVEKKRKLLVDENLPDVPDDPRIINGRKEARNSGGGQNTESFDPKSTLVRPEMRIVFGKKQSEITQIMKQ